MTAKRRPIEDFLKVFEDVSGRDLSQFALWYHQAGTPNVTVAASHNAAKPGIRAGDRAVGSADAFGKPQAADAHSAGFRAGRAGRKGPVPTTASKGLSSRTASSTSASAARWCASPAWRASGSVAQSRLLGAGDAFGRAEAPKTSSSWRAMTAMPSPAGRPSTRCSPMR